jgi:hypothetical protein
MKIDRPKIDVIQTSSGTLSLGANNLRTTGTGYFGAIQVTSSTGIANLNADMVDGKHASEFEPTLSKGSLTATAPVYFDQTRQVIGGAAVASLKNDAASTITSFSTDTTLVGNSDTDIPTEKAVKTYADNLVLNLLDYRGAYSASSNVFPTSTGSGAGGAILKGDMWIISSTGILGGQAVQIGDSIIALVDTPGQTATNWNILNGNISYVPEDVANKKISLAENSDTYYPTQKAVKTAVDAKQNTLTTGNMTASLPILLDQARQVIGGSVVVSHSTSTGYIHLPTAGASNQILKNSGASGTGAWGTVTENSGALAAITTIGMSGQLTNTVAISTAPMVITSTTKVANLNVDKVDDLDAQTLSATAPIVLSGATSVLAAGAIAITHSTSTGYVHLPTAGASAQLIQYSEAGTGKWITVSGDVSIADGGAVTIGANKVTLAMHATQAADTVLANATASTAVPSAVTMAEQTVLGRVTGGHIDDISIGIANDNILQVDDASAADNDYAKFTAAGVEGVPYSTVLSDIGAVPTSLTLTATAPITIDGTTSANLSTGRTLAIVAATTSVPGSMSAADKTKLDGVAISATRIPIATASGTNTITANFSPDIALTDQTVCMIVAAGINTSTGPTFNPDGLGARIITKKGGSSLVAGDIPGALAVCILEYNLENTRWELLNPAVPCYQ